MDSIHLDGRKAIIEEAMDSGEFFLSGLRQRISGLQSRRDGLKSLLNSLESEERVLRVQHNKVQGALLSQDQRHRQEMEVLKSEFKTSEEVLWASRMEKEEKCRKLEIEIDSIRRRRGLENRPS